MSVINKEFEKFNIQIQPITTLDFLQELKSFSQLLVTSIGPRSKLKMIESEGGINILTTSSKRLIDWVELDSPVLQVIANAMKGQWQMYSDFGLFTGITSMSLLLNALDHHMPSSRKSNLFKCICSVSLSLLESSNIRVKVDFSSMKNLEQVIQTVITSKPLSCSPTLINVPSLAMCIVQAFIHGYSEEKDSLGRVSVLVEEGPVSEIPSVFSGVLYPKPEVNPETEWKWSTAIKDEKKSILVALFAVNLSTSNQNGNNEEDDIEFAEGCREVQDQFLLEKIESACEKLLEAGVSVFACQKVVHPHIQLILQRRDALVLERMGKELADSFSALSGAVPIGDILFENIPEGCIGEVDEIEHITRAQKSYLLIKCESCEGVATILAYAAGEQEAAELKVVIHQSLQSLCHLISQPFVLPGSGCLEVWLAEELQLAILQELDKYCKDYDCSKLEILTVLRWFRTTLFNMNKYILGISEPVIVMDSIYHHSWKEVGAGICNCGLVNRDSLEKLGDEWVEVEIDTIEESLGNLLPQRKWTNVNDGKGSYKVITPQLNFSDVARVDIMSSKLNAYRLAMDTCQSIMSIGMVVY